MAKSIFFSLLLFISAWELSNALTCYNCYKNLATTFLRFNPRDQNNIPCTDNIDNWNVWDCPGTSPVCSKVHMKLGESAVITRSCSTEAADICVNGLPGGVEVVSCVTCNTDLCNGESADDPGAPDNSTCPSMTLDINLNVNLNVHQIN